MRSPLVVDLAQHVQRGLQFDVVRDLAHPQHLLERGPDSFDSAVHPWAMRQRPLVVDAKPLQREGEDPGREDCFVVGADRFRLAVVFDGIQQQSKNGDRRSNVQRAKRQHASAAMIEDTQQRLRRLRFDAVLGDNDRPDTIHRAGALDRMRMSFWRRSPLFELAQELRNISLADRPSMIDVIAVEPIRDHAATGIGCLHRNPE